MFRRKQNKSIEVTKLSSLVSANVQVAGDLIFTGGVRIDGQVQGNVIGKEGDHGLLVLSEKGAITGNVRVYDAVINGTICGDVEVGHFLELQANARVTGNITYRQLQMECGAHIDGRLERSGDAAATATDAASNVVSLTVATA
ncbi:MAG: polymer-forming cytoskeletal protein [Steroidobacteraceae bacterium]